ncbi:hypothetical protein JCM10207_003731 [Rhodosporidiobolus poonsookiae]
MGGELYGYQAIFYGLAVSLRSLHRARIAWQSVRGSLLFLTLRIARPLPAGERTQAVDRLPNEVWSLIGAALRAIAIEEAMRANLKLSVCRECGPKHPLRMLWPELGSGADEDDDDEDNGDDNDEDSSNGGQTSASDASGSDASGTSDETSGTDMSDGRAFCDQTFYERWQSNGRMNDHLRADFDEQYGFEPIQKFLQAQGFYLPANNVYRARRFPLMDGESPPAVPVPPLRLTVLLAADTYPSVDERSIEVNTQWINDGGDLMALDPTVLPGTDERFRRLIDEWQLEPVQTNKHVKSMRGVSTELGEKDDSEVKPMWRVFTVFGRSD